VLPTTSPAAKPSARALTLRVLDDGRTADLSIHRADTFVGRLVGLMGRRRLAPSEGLYLPGTASIHMLFMRFAIDCVFLSPPAPDGSQRVVAIRRALPPWTGVVWWIRGVGGVLELTAGASERLNLQVGDAVRFEDVQSPTTAVAPG
jgi:uncharacterized protein